MVGLCKGNFGSTIPLFYSQFSRCVGGATALPALNKFDSLRAVLRGYESCLVAYSGGVDSVLLAVVAYEQLGDQMLAVIADSPSLPRRELAEAKSLAQQYGFPLKILRTSEFENPDYADNPINRCYYCKHELFQKHTVLVACVEAIF